MLKLHFFLYYLVLITSQCVNVYIIAFITHGVFWYVCACTWHRFNCNWSYFEFSVCKQNDTIKKSVTNNHSFRTTGGVVSHAGVSVKKKQQFSFLVCLWFHRCVIPHLTFWQCWITDHMENDDCINISLFVLNKWASSLLTLPFAIMVIVCHATVHQTI